MSGKHLYPIILKAFALFMSWNRLFLRTLLIVSIDQIIQAVFISPQNHIILYETFNESQKLPLIHDKIKGFWLFRDQRTLILSKK
jgi:hypothetical protein